MNTKLLLQIAEDMLKRPTQVNMYDWATDENAIGDEPGGCGTAGCIAGFALARRSFRGNLMKMRDRYCRDGRNPETHAAIALDLTDEEADRLFYLDHWPVELQRAYTDAYSYTGDQLTVAKVTAKRIKLFVKTKGKK